MVFGYIQIWAILAQIKTSFMVFGYIPIWAMLALSFQKCILIFFNRQIKMLKHFGKI